MLTARCWLAGAHGPDLVIFLGLAVYAVAGCKAQDLRVESSNQVQARSHSTGRPIMC